MKFDLYDFDKTVYPHDSETDFLLYCMARKPWLAFLIPYQAVCLALFFLGFGDKFKGKCFVFLRFVDGEKEARRFWQKKRDRIYPIFNPENRSGRPIVVCSASPEFFLKPICDEFGVDVLIATRMDKKTGEIIGNNCKDKQKPLRLAERLPDAEFVNVYSDSLKNDIHIFRLGKKCFHAVKGTLTQMTLDEIEKRVQSK